MEISFTKEELFWLILAGSFFTLFVSTSFALMYFFYRKRLTDQLLKTTEIELQKKSELLESQIIGQDSEREKIARAIHDEISSKLAILQISIEHLKRINLEKNQEETDLIVEIIEKLIASTESISHGLLPPDLEHAGLISAVNGVVEVLNKTGELAIDYTWIDLSNGQHFKETELGVYRIIHELMHNTIKYANAKNVRLNIELNRTSLAISYSDDGAGFNMEEAMNKGLGIRSILSRVQFLNASYNFHSELGQGMEFTLKKIR